MATASAEAGRQFTQPYRQLLTMVIIVALVGAGAYQAFAQIEDVVLSNLWLNGVILGVFAVGVLACFWQVIALSSSVSWIGRFLGDRDNAGEAPGLLSSLQALLNQKKGPLKLGTSSARSILDTVGTRIEEAREVTRYITGLLIFLGLLGTFFGLATTVPAVVETIQSLKPTAEEGGVAVFSRLMAGLEDQLGGMGTAFSSSLLGLTGSLVVGLLELFAGHGQNRFYRELENWLSTITRIGFSGEAEGGAADLSAFDEVFEGLERAINHLGEQSQGVGEKLDNLVKHIVAADAGRAAADKQMAKLGSAIEALARANDSRDGGPGLSEDKVNALGRAIERLTASMEKSRPAEGANGQMAAQIAALEKVAGGQEKLVEFLGNDVGERGTDSESRMRLKNIDIQLLRILEEMAAGRQDMVAELRQDLAALSKALRQNARANAAAATDEAAGGRRKV